MAKNNRKKVKIIREERKSDFFGIFVNILISNFFLICFWLVFIILLSTFFLRAPNIGSFFSKNIILFILISVVIQLIFLTYLMAYNLSEEEIIKKEEIVEIEEVRKK